MTIIPLQSILVVDDDAQLSEFIGAAATQMGIPCSCASDAASCFEQLTDSITIVMIDLVMPGLDGIELLRLLMRRGCRAKIVLMSGLGDRVIETAQQVARSMGLAVAGQLRKPFALLDLERILSGIEDLPVTKAGPTKTQLHISDGEIVSALQRGEFVLHYQPQIDLITGRIVAVEALTRWFHPDHGLLYPDNFIVRVEALGLADEFFWYVARRGFADVQLFYTATGYVPKLSLNISAKSLQALTFPDRFIALANEFGIRPEDTVLEITESGMVEQPETLDVLARLRMKLVELSIDDFGTGYSMMQQLQTIPATELKIDKAFVQNAAQSKSDRVIVVKTIELGHDLGIRVIAEGVETAEQLDFVMQCGCDIVQGYYFTKPLPACDLIVWLQQFGGVAEKMNVQVPTAA